MPLKTKAKKILKPKPKTRKPVKTKIIKYRIGNMTYVLPERTVKTILSFFPNLGIHNLTNIPTQQNNRVLQMLERMPKKQLKELKEMILFISSTVNIQLVQAQQMSGQKRPFEDLMQNLATIEYFKKSKKLKR
jgi:hypothetical protein